MTVLAELVRSHIARWQSASVEIGVFGTSEPDRVAAYFEVFCLEHLGTGVQSALFYGSSAGCVAGLRLDDASEVVVKAYQPAWEEGFLAGVVAVQAHLSERGFPCAKPLLGPARAGPAWATVETFVADPGMKAFSTKEEMNASASGLGTLVDACRPLDLPALGGHPLNPSADRLYPTPHNPIFDFSMGAEAAGWIDDFARAAKDARQVDASPPVIGHTDWSARNIRIEQVALVAVYDWDSMALCAESTLVGQAAATWRSTGEIDDPIAPDADDVLEYTAAYEKASGRVFDSTQTRATLAAALWVLAYSARCEHALEMVTGHHVERARARLADGGRAFLSS
ncbi:MAG TPA: phosphotransferase [Acidimicrobiales bacterium]